MQKISISKEALLQLVGENERKFLTKIDNIGGEELLSIGKWHKLYALMAIARQASGLNYFIYESPNLYDYDASCHRVYQHGTHVNFVRSKNDGSN